MNILYTARATASGGREGITRSDDDKINLPLSYPKEMGGSGDGTNPEQLFAAGYAACFSNAILHVAKLQKTPLTKAEVNAHVGIGARESGGFALDVDLQIQLDLPQEQAAPLVQAAHQVCPYSNALRNNVAVRLQVNGTVLQD